MDLAIGSISINYVDGNTNFLEGLVHIIPLLVVFIDPTRKVEFIIVASTLQRCFARSTIWIDSEAIGFSAS